MSDGKNSKALVLALLAAAAPAVAEAMSPIESQEALTPECIYKRTWEPTKNPSILIPLYTVGSEVKMNTTTGACAHHMFVDVSKGCRAVVAVVNPATGPRPLDHPEVPAIKACLKLLNDHNVQMIGYTHSKIATVNPATGVWSTSGMRPVAEVAHDMDVWLETAKGLPMFKGFFIDDTTNFYQTSINAFGIDHVKWYRDLVNMAKQKLTHSRIVLNPGSFVDLRLMRANATEGYPEAADITIPFEDYAYKWRPADDNCSQKGIQWNTNQGSFGPGPWCPNVPNGDKVEPFKEAVKRREFEASAVVHSATKEFMFRERKVAYENGFKYFYATDIPLVQGPWGRVPIGWDEYLKVLNNDEESVAPQETTTVPINTPSPTAAPIDPKPSSSPQSSPVGVLMPLLAAMTVIFAQIL